MHEIPEIANYYGGLTFFEDKEKGKFFWGIEDGGYPDYHEISESLFNELMKHTGKGKC